MLASLRLLAVLAVLIPLPARAQVMPPGNVSLCADLAMEVVAVPKGRDLGTALLRIHNLDPGHCPRLRGRQWVEHVGAVTPVSF
jgi:hypothetical protein